jgi:hypothetical protein
MAGFLIRLSFFADSNVKNTFSYMIQGYEDNPSDNGKGPRCLFTCYTDLFITFLPFGS